MTQYLKNYLKHNNIIFLNTDDILKLYDLIMKCYGGIAGIRDKGLLESAINQSQLLLQYKDTDIYDLAAAYCFYIIKNHPFIDGNKRTGILVALSFLEINDVNINFEHESLYQLSISIADSSLKLDEISQFFRNSQSNAN